MNAVAITATVAAYGGQAYLIRSSSLRRSADEQERHHFLSVVGGFWVKRLGLSPMPMSFHPVQRADHQSDVAPNDGGDAGGLSLPVNNSPLYRCFPDGSGPLGAVPGHHTPKAIRGRRCSKGGGGACFCRSAKPSNLREIRFEVTARRGSNL